MRTIRDLREEKPLTILFSSKKEINGTARPLTEQEERAFNAGFRKGNDALWYEARQEAIRWIERKMELDDWDERLEEMGIVDGHHEDFRGVFMKFFDIKEEEIETEEDKKKREKEEGEVLPLDELSGQCGYADTDAPVSCHWGCGHPDNTDKETFEGKEYGQCYPWACPLAIELSPDQEEEDLKLLKEVYGEHYIYNGGIYMRMRQSPLPKSKDLTKDEPKNKATNIAINRQQYHAKAPCR